MKKYKLYLFDFDGTLFDTIPSLEHVFVEAYKVVGINISPKESKELARKPLLEPYLEKGGKMTDFQKFVDKIGDNLNTKETVELSKKYFDTDIFLKYLKNNNIYCGIVTSNNKNHVQDILNFFNIPLDIFSIYVGNNEYDKDKFKPHPDPILAALKLDERHIDKKDVIYVGDALNDCKCAINAGVNCLLLDRDHEFNDINEYDKVYSLMEIFGEQ